MSYSQITVRRLAWLCGGLSAGIALALKADGAALLLCALSAASGIVPLLLCKNLNRLRLGIFFLAMSCGLIYGGLWSSSYLEPVLELDGETVNVTARALDVPREKNGYTVLSLRMQPVNSPAFTAQLYDYKNILPSGIQAGYRVSGSFSLRRGDMLRGEAYEGALSRGVQMLAYPEGEVEIIPDGAVFDLPRRLCRAVELQTDRLFPEDVRGFQKALLTGEKSGLYADESLSRAVSRSGIAHVVAVSGMHMAYIVGFITLLFGTRRAMVPGAAAIVLFMLMTGMTPPVVRAGVLYMSVLTAPAFRRESDKPTMLLLALAAILLQNPMAAYSISLQLSFAAMAGILIFALPMADWAQQMLRPYCKNRIIKNVLMSLVGIASVSVSASLLTSPLAAVHFGYFSVYSILTNLLIGAVVSVVFVLGYIACAAGAVFPPAGRLIANITAAGLRYVLLCARTVAEIPGSVLYTENPIYMQALIFALLIFGVAWLLRGGEGFRPLFPACLAAVAMCACCFMVNLAAPHLAPRITALDVGQGQCIVMLSGDRAVVIDCGGSEGNAGDTAASYLLSRGVRRLDALVLTHLHADHANGAQRLLETVETDRLILAPEMDDSAALLPGLLSAADSCGTQICIVDKNMRLTAGDIGLTLMAPLGSGDANERCLLVHGGIDGFEALITGDAGSAVERELIHTADLSDTELLIAGHHGSANSSCLELMEALRPEYSVLSVGFNSYGHPAAQALERLRGFGAQLFRTDKNGNITFYIGENHG
ncbi:MAG: ComEC/Rec2 family competence protein [Candidatus Heteroscillospira sp.]|jgi:competence protein ComEC